MDYEFKRWCETACSHIRFKPDRERVKQELQWHIEDKIEALADSEKTLGQRREAVLEAMGDADEVGKALAKQHKPWLGWLWLASRRILVFTVIVALMCSVNFRIMLGLEGNRSRNNRDFTEANTVLGNRLLLVKPNSVARTDGYTIRITRAAKWHLDYVDDTGARQIRDELYFTIDTMNWLPWAAEPVGVFYFSAVDSKGNTYTNRIQRGERSIVGSLEWRGIFACRFEMRVEGLDPEANWIELKYDRSGRQFSLLIPLKEGVTQ